MENIGVVILHYKTSEKTIDCVNSFLNIDSSSFKPHIVVVCNTGGDKSDCEIGYKYQDSSAVEVVSTPKPLVFARAMNVGVKALEQYHPKFIILSNNDIIFDEPQMYLKIDEEYKQSHFGAMGPDVHTISSDTHSSPFYIRYYFSWFANVKIIILILRSYFLRQWKKEPDKEFIYNNKQYKKRVENKMLQGSFVILSKDYLARFPQGLYPQKSFFLEENILLYLCQKFNLKTVYNPSIKVDHIHSVSIDQRFQDKAKKRKFVMVETLRSRHTFLHIIARYNLTKHIKYSHRKEKAK